MFLGEREKRIVVITRSTMAEDGVPVQMQGRLFVETYVE